MSWNIFCKATKTDFKFIFYDSVSHINVEHWNKVISSRNIYLSLEYLHALEESMRGTMEFRYILFYDEELKPCAAAVVQLLNFSEESSEHQELLAKAGVKIKHKLPKTLNIKVMICGNAFACGENGFAYTNGISGEEAYSILADGLDRLRKSENEKGAVSLVLLKDFWLPTSASSDVLKEADFKDFMIDVNMVLKLNKGWNTLDDYLDTMKTKFRTKANGVFRKSEMVKEIDLSKEDIQKHKTKIEELFNNVVEKADLKFRSLNGDSFLNFKKAFEDDFIFKGYFLGDKLVGFTSAFVFNAVVDANYVGIDYNFNQQYALYQRMLYDLVDLAISTRSSELRLGRTAEEIKSSMGAEPVNMKLYVLGGNRIFSKLLKPIVSSIRPSEFERRKPFKEVHIFSGQKEKMPLRLIKKELLHSEK